MTRIKAINIDNVTRTHCSNVALRYSALRGDVATMGWLLRNGPADIDSAQFEGFTAIHCSAHNGRVTALEWLAARDANMQTTSLRGYNALHIAASSGQVPAAAWLIRVAGLAPTSCSVDLCTPLHLAAQNGHAPMIELLVACGAAAEACTERGYSALQFADMAYVRRAPSIARAHACLCTPLHADPPAPPRPPSLPTHAACPRRGHTEATALLLLAMDGAELQASRSDVTAPLCIAASERPDDTWAQWWAHWWTSCRCCRRHLCSRRRRSIVAED